MQDFDTAISYYLPPDSAWTLVTMDNYKVLSDLDNAWIRILNLGLDPLGSLSLTASGNSTYISGATNQTIYDWVIQ
jgi:outer membrane protease